MGPLSKSLTAALRWKITKSSPRVVRNALTAAGFTLVNGRDKWLAYWGKHLTSDKFEKFSPFQTINHFPYSFEIGRKDKLWLNYCNMRNIHGSSAVNHIPETFLLPRNRSNLDRAFHTSNAWIIKPPASARGIGIKVITKPTSLPSTKKRKEVICSKYISNPFLINKRKFDLRLYVLVTSFEPLRVYLYDYGLARFASESYTKMSGGKKSTYRYSHLTNYSINKKNKHEVLNSGIFAESERFAMKDNKWYILNCF